MEEADAIEELVQLLRGNFADVILLWQEEIPWDILDDTSIEETQNYSCRAPLAGNVPRYYILDERANVVFVGKSMDELMQKFITLEKVEIEGLQKAADEYIYMRFGSEKGIEQVKMVEFSMIGCKDCEAAAPIVRDVETQHRIVIETIYCDKENVPQEQKHNVDHGNILAHIYGIRWYPSFVGFQESGRLIFGKSTEEELKAALLQALREEIE